MAVREYKRVLALAGGRAEGQAKRPSFFRLHFDPFGDITAFSFYTRVPPRQLPDEIVFVCHWSNALGDWGATEYYADFSKMMLLEGLYKSGYEQYQLYPDNAYYYVAGKHYG
jgi:hypothetical protein